MKVLAYIPLHYGAEYLDATIRSIDDNVDQILILYTEQPSYGQQGRLRNPDSRAQLREIADSASKKIKWVDIPQTGQEHQHRQMVHGYAKGFDLIMAVDADEVWHPDHVREAQEAALATGLKNVSVGGDRWYHFWRSFNEVNQDGFYPVRFHCVGGSNGATIIHKGLVYHMGYAQSEGITRYKISVHGHKSIPGSWFNDKWLNYVKGKTTKLHPDSQDVWIETKDFDKETLPQILKDHPYYDLERIK